LAAVLFAEAPPFCNDFQYAAVPFKLAYELAALHKAISFIA
jgi:hypothetical protein